MPNQHLPEDQAGVLDPSDLQLITAQEVCSILNIGITTLDGIRQTDDFPKPVRIGAKAVRWRLSEVRRWIEQGGSAAREKQRVRTA